MQSNAQSPEEYISQVDDKYREAISMLRKTILENIPSGFSYKNSKFQAELTWNLEF